jgi:hypothetical protein
VNQLADWINLTFEGEEPWQAQKKKTWAQKWWFNLELH